LKELTEEEKATESGWRFHELTVKCYCLKNCFDFFENNEKEGVEVRRLVREWRAICLRLLEKDLVEVSERREKDLVSKHMLNSNIFISSQNLVLNENILKN